MSKSGAGTAFSQPKLNGVLETITAMRYKIHHSKNLQTSISQGVMSSTSAVKKPGVSSRTRSKRNWKIVPMFRSQRAQLGRLRRAKADPEDVGRHHRDTDDAQLQLAQGNGA